MQLSVTDTFVQSNLPLLGSECEICVEETAANTVYLHTSIQNLKSQSIDDWPIFHKHSAVSVTHIDETHIHTNTHCWFLYCVSGIAGSFTCIGRMRLHGWRIDCCRDFSPKPERPDHVPLDALCWPPHPSHTHTHTHTCTHTQCWVECYIWCFIYYSIKSKNQSSVISW